MIWAFAAAAEEPLDVYLAQRLDVVETEVTTVYAKAYDGSGRFWFVVDGKGALIDAKQLAENVGDEARVQAARRSRDRRAALGVALLGLGATSLTIGVVPSLGVGGGGPGNASDPVASTLAGVLGGGLIASSTLVWGGGIRQRHPSALFTEDDARAAVSAYNERLRDEILGP